jgi:hypothetical protein
MSVKKTRIRHIGSIKTELIHKSREAMLSAIQIFNNPNMSFKSESFCVLSIIAWTYLMHAYYRKDGIEYRYFDVQAGDKKKFHKTKKGAYKHWELERCLNEDKSPIDSITASNLKFLIGLRHEIEHQMTSRIDDLLSAKFQACCLNFNAYIKKLHGDQYGIDKHLSFSLQLSTLSEEQINTLRDAKNLPVNISTYILDFDTSLSEDAYSDQRYSYRVFFVQKTANRKGQADRVIEFIKPDSPAAIGLNKEQIMIKDREKPKFLPTEILKIAKENGFPKFRIHNHTDLWKSLNAKAAPECYGVLVSKTWYWYENWKDMVLSHCKEKSEIYA